MRKNAQLAPENDPLAGLSAMPELGGGGTDALNAPSGASQGAPPAQPKEKVYKGLSSPEDIMSDFQLSEALQEQYADADLASKIWQLYGGDSLGLNALPNKVGEWPIDDSGKNNDPKFTEIRFNDTEDDINRYKRLAQGYTIKDIFNNEAEIQRLITYTISTIQKGAKQPQANTVSWYKHAQNKL